MCVGGYAYLLSAACVSVHLYVCLSVCLFVCLSVCLPLCLSARLPVLSACLSACLFACLSCVYVGRFIGLSACLSASLVVSLSARLFVLYACLSIGLLVCLPVCPSVCLYVCLSACLSVRLSVCMYVCLYACLYVCPSVCLSVSLSVCRSVGLSVFLPVCPYFRIVCHLSTAPPEKAKDEFDPIAYAEVKCVPSGFTKWDRTWIDKGDLTVKQFLEAFKEITGEWGILDTMHGRSRSRMTVDLRTPARPGRATLGFHRPGRQCLHQARSTVRCGASRMKGELHHTKKRL